MLCDVNKYGNITAKAVYILHVQFYTYTLLRYIYFGVKHLDNYFFMFLYIISNIYIADIC
jgi:hypothetical protein